MKLTGYAALWDVPSVGGIDGLLCCEQFAPGCFTRTVAQAMRGERSIPLLLNHNKRRWLAATRRSNLRLGTDQTGLWFEADGVKLPAGFQGVSPRFIPTRWKRTGDFLIVVSEAVLIEVSLCTKPVCYPQTAATVREVTTDGRK